MNSALVAPLVHKLDLTPLEAAHDDAVAQALAHAVDGIVRSDAARLGAPLATLTMREAVQPLVDGRPHGVYLVLVEDEVLYVGSNTGRAFHDRLAGHLDPGARGWFNSCVKVMVRSGRCGDTAEALDMLFNRCRVVFFPIGSVGRERRLRTVILKLENELRVTLSPLNRRASKRGAGERESVDALTARLEHAYTLLEHAVSIESDADADADAAEELESDDLERGEILYVKCGATWPGEKGELAAKQASVLGDWKINLARARRVRTVVGVANGSVKGAWDVQPWSGVTVGDDRVRFQPAVERFDVELLLARLEGRTLGWTWTYRPA